MERQLSNKVLDNLGVTRTAMPWRNVDRAVVNHPIELVIFDCDGVLVDSERIAIRIDAIVLGKLGWHLTETEIVERFVGRSTESFVAEIEAHIGRSLPSDWEDEFEPLYREALARELAPVDGIVEALDAITLPTCVASSGSHDKMRFTLGLTGLYERFAGRIFSASEVSRGKPEPDLLLHAAARMGVAPTACVVVEDSEPGVQAARAAGMRVFAYAGGVTPAVRLAVDATVVFDDMRVLPSLLFDRPNADDAVSDGATASTGVQRARRPSTTTPIVIGVSRSAAHGVGKDPETVITLVAGHGVEGDAHFGQTVQHRSRVAVDPTQPNLRQVHLIHAELLEELATAGFAVEPGQMGENITTIGVDLLGLPRGATLRVGDDVVIEVTGLRNPCRQLDSLQNGLMTATLDRADDGALIRKAGIMGIVVVGGPVRAGDVIRVELPPPPLGRLDRV